MILHGEWDKEDVYDSEIAPLMAKIIEICKRESIPMAATFQYCDQGENGPGYCTTTMPNGRASERLLRVIGAMQPEHAHVTLAETQVTDPVTGRTTLTIRRVT